MYIKAVYQDIATIINAIENNEKELAHIETRLETVSSKEDTADYMIKSLILSKERVEECIASHVERLEFLVEQTDLLPHGAGFDCGTRLDLDNSTSEELIFFTEFHHMDEEGSYCGWSYWTVTVTATLVLGFNVKAEKTDDDLEGDDKEYSLYAFKNYIENEFQHCLEREFDTHADKYLPAYMRSSA
jgi:hypothetical protein